MNKQGIKLAREILDLPDTLTDEEIADELRGSSLEKRIELKLAVDDLVYAFVEAAQPIRQAFAQAFDQASRPFDRR